MSLINTLAFLTFALENLPGAKPNAQAAAIVAFMLGKYITQVYTFWLYKENLAGAKNWRWPWLT